MKKLISMIVLLVFIAGPAYAVSYGNDAVAVSKSTSSAQVVNGQGAGVGGAVIIPPEINPFNIPILQGGRIGDMTAAMPLFADASLTPLGKDDRIIEVLDVFSGNIFSRITYGEVETFLLSKAKKYSGKTNIRYSVKYQDSAISSGVGGGLAGSLTSSNGFDSATGVGAILPGVHRSTANPLFIITFYRVQ